MRRRGVRRLLPSSAEVSVKPRHAGVLKAFLRLDRLPPVSLLHRQRLRLWPFLCIFLRGTHDPRLLCPRSGSATAAVRSERVECWLGCFQRSFSVMVLFSEVEFRRRRQQAQEARNICAFLDWTHRRTSIRVTDGQAAFVKRLTLCLTLIETIVSRHLWEYARCGRVVAGSATRSDIDGHLSGLRSAVGADSTHSSIGSSSSSSRGGHKSGHVLVLVWKGDSFDGDNPVL